MEKILLEFDNKTIEKIDNIALRFNMSVSSYIKQLVIAQINTFLPNCDINNVKKTDHFVYAQEEKDILKRLMSTYEIKQNDIADFLNISHSAVSLHFSGRQENSKLKAHLNQQSEEHFLIQVLLSKYTNRALAEVTVGLDVQSPTLRMQNIEYNGQNAYDIVKNWPDYKKILFGYFISIHHIPNNRGLIYSKENIFQKVCKFNQKQEMELQIHQENIVKLQKYLKDEFKSLFTK
ncbi:hypothetical protein SUSP_002614 [Sulfurospirillum sp. 'SP']|nr:helix-turn-helix domain-containing protein [Sulfurospirillum sp. 'SP']WNZ00197.1 hypothetical protein SUSP_002614 [Sulfurospirillum sp. 'SP']